MASAGGEERRVLTIFWRIENMKLMERVNMTGIGSSPFRARVLEGKKFKMDALPKGRGGNGKNINLLIYLRDKFPLDFPIDCEWSFIGSNGLPLVIGTMRKHVIRRHYPLIVSDCPTYEDVFVTRKSAFFLRDTLTIRFRIWKSDGNLSTNEFISCRSKIEAMYHTFLWTIPRFSALQLNQEVSTPVTFGNILSPDNFLLKLSLEGESLEDSSVNVELTASYTSCLFVAHLQLSALDREQKVIAKTRIERESIPKVVNETSKLPDLVLSRKELLRNKYDCLKHDILTLRCEWLVAFFIDFIDKHCHGYSNLEMHGTEHFSTLLDASCPPSEHSVEQPNTFLQRIDSLTFLGEDLLSLYREQSMTDFELYSGDISFPVHKNILSARSPVFKAMFSSCMKESDSDSQNVPDLDVHTLNRMLTFLYGGTLEPDLHLESAAKLYYAADKYQVESLKQQCSSIIQSGVSVANVSDILTLADRHRDEELKLFVHDFFLQNFDDILRSEEWENFQQHEPVFAGNTVLQMYKKKFEKKRP